MSNLVAVYGSLRKGFGNHTLLSDDNTQYVGQCHTAPEYTMRSLGYFPGIYEEGDTAIVIEVYEVSDRVFRRLDGLEGYPRFYNRKEIDTPFGKAWVYFLRDYQTDAPVVESGDWSKR